MTQKSEVGRIGEDLACEYLIGKGYKIVERNYRHKWGELDVIAQDPDDTLVFVEVKTLQQIQCKQCGNAATCGENCRIIAALNPEDNLTAAKLIKLQRTAQLFAGFRNDLVNEKKGWRIDLIAIDLLPNLESVKQTVKHYKNI